MAFDKDLYNGYKEIASSFVRNMPYLYKGDPLDWIMGNVGMMKDLMDSEDYEAMMAIKDSILEYLKETFKDFLTEKEIDRFVEMSIDKEFENELKTRSNEKD